jgi:Family of unknown function (DUF6920)
MNMVERTNAAMSAATRSLLARLSRFCFPGGEDVARSISGVELQEAGEMRLAPEAHWVPFVARKVIESASSYFRWEARLDRSTRMAAKICDEYDGAHGRSTMKIGILPVRRITTPDADVGELQRYLASAVLCPSMILNNPALKFDAVGPNTLTLSDRQNPKAQVDIDISQDGQPLGCWAFRPRIAGRKMLWGRWFARGFDFHEWEVLRIPFQMEAKWHLPEGDFAYFRSSVKSIRRLKPQ